MCVCAPKPGGCSYPVCDWDRPEGLSASAAQVPSVVDDDQTTYGRVHRESAIEKLVRAMYGRPSEAWLRSRVPLSVDPVRRGRWTVSKGAQTRRGCWRVIGPDGSLVVVVERWDTALAAAVWMAPLLQGSGRTVV